MPNEHAPRPAQTQTPIVGIGASAGGIEHPQVNLAPDTVYVIAPDRKLESTDIALGESRIALTGTRPWARSYGG